MRGTAANRMARQQAPVRSISTPDTATPTSRGGPGSGPSGGPAIVAARSLTSRTSAWPPAGTQTVVSAVARVPASTEPAAPAKPERGRRRSPPAASRATRTRAPARRARRASRTRGSRPGCPAASTRPRPAPGSPTTPGTAGRPPTARGRRSRPRGSRQVRTVSRRRDRNRYGGAPFVSANRPVAKSSRRADVGNGVYVNVPSPVDVRACDRVVPELDVPPRLGALAPVAGDRVGEQPDRAGRGAVDPVAYPRLPGDREARHRPARQQAVDRRSRRRCRRTRRRRGRPRARPPGAEAARARGRSARGRRRRRRRRRRPAARPTRRGSRRSAPTRASRPGGRAPA